MKMLALDGSNNNWLWDRNKFINRKFLMQEMYQNYIEGDENWDLPQVKLRNIFALAVICCLIYHWPEVSH